MTERNDEYPEGTLEEHAAAVSERLSGRTVSVQTSRVGVIEGGQVHLHNSSVGRANARALQLERSAAGVVVAGAVEAHDSATGAVIAREATLQQTSTPLVLAGRVSAETIHAAVLAAGRVDGVVHTALTPLTALAVGAGFGLAVVGLQWLGRALVRRAARGDRTEIAPRQ
jgi:hypothetical protein